VSSLQRRLGERIAPIGPPKFFHVDNLAFQPTVIADSGLTTHYAVSDDFPAYANVLEFQPVAIAGSSLSLGYAVSDDFLPLLLEIAQPETSRTTYLFGLHTLPQDGHLSATVIKADRVPLTVQQFAIDPLPSQLAISKNRLRVLGNVTVMGMNYRDRIWRQLHLPESKKPAVRKEGGTKPLSNIDIEAEERKGRKSNPKPPSFWDLLFIILQPPLVLEQLENLFLPHELRSYQPAGVEFLMRNESALLADEMGTGKTVMTTLALRILMQKGRANRALVVCPLSVLRVWDSHLAEWAPDLHVVLIRGSRDMRKLDWEIPAHVYVIAYDTLRSDIENRILPYHKLDKFDIVVLDEAQYTKNPASNRSHAIKKLRARHRWALTGTPIENKIEDVASLFEFLRPGYLTPFDLYPARVREKISPYFLRRRKADVLPELPAKQRQDQWLELDSDQRAAYDQTAEVVRVELTALGTRVRKIDIFRNINRLKQICNFAPGQSTSPKVQFLKEQIEEITESGQKVIVFSQYLGEGVDKLEEALKPYGTAKIVGSQTEAIRARQIERFKHSTGVPLLLASVRAGGVGLNLTEASYVIHFDHWWNPAVMWQAEDRVHRLGQTRGVNVYSYWMVDTIEERVYNTLQEKGLLFADIVDGLSDTRIDDLITVDEWLDMLGVKRKDEPQPKAIQETFQSLSLLDIREELYKITPARFEHLVKELMQSLGYPNVRVTGRRGDGGIDVISTRNTSRGVVRAVAQCKRYRGTVGPEVARELRGVMASDGNIEKGFLVTTGDFSSECVRFCEKSGVIVPISGIEVARYVKSFGLAV